LDIAASVAQTLRIYALWDALLVTLVAYGLVSGWRRGALRQCSLLAGLFAGLALAIWQSPNYSALVGAAGLDLRYAQAITFLAIYGGVIISTWAFLRGLHIDAESDWGQAVNHALGAVAGGVTGVVALVGTMLPLQVMVSSYGYTASVSGWLGSIEPLILGVPKHLHL
jgi:uncharacterized membrane protein required for colicin V production